MLTKSRMQAELDLLPEVEYPPEVVERWVKEGEVALLQYATGEIQPLDLAKFAAEHGLKLGD